MMLRSNHNHCAARSLLSLLLLWLCTLSASGQERRVQNRPYLDERRLHYGFLLGVQMMDLELKNNGYVDPNTGEQWYADVDNYSPGFNVGVLAELKLHKHFSLRVAPTLYFGQKHVWMHEQVSGRDTTQNIRSTIVSVPVNIKMSAPRYNNFRPYAIVGVSPSVDLTTRKHNALRLNMFDCYLELGLGCDIYLKHFKLNPELKFCFGLANVLNKDRSDLIDSSLSKYTHALDAAHAKMVVLSVYFE